MNHLWVTGLTWILCHIVLNALEFGELLTCTQAHRPQSSFSNCEFLFSNKGGKRRCFCDSTVLFDYIRGRFYDKGKNKQECSCLRLRDTFANHLFITLICRKLRVWKKNSRCTSVSCFFVASLQNCLQFTFCIQIAFSIPGTVTDCWCHINW